VLPVRYELNLYMSEFLATDPEARVRFPALPEKIVERGPLKLAITSPTSGGRSVGIVRSRTQTMEFFFLILRILKLFL
jgi:hypothetical protein